MRQTPKPHQCHTRSRWWCLVHLITSKRRTKATGAANIGINENRIDESVTDILAAKLWTEIDRWRCAANLRNVYAYACVVCHTIWTESESRSCSFIFVFVFSFFSSHFSFCWRLMLTSIHSCVAACACHNKNHWDIYFSSFHLSRTKIGATEWLN